ncbi:MAG: type IV-A pilus assembly ATPase PilB [Gammaproteobacteria bacterium]
MSSPPNVMLSGLARRLVTDGLISDTTAREALRTAQQQKIPLAKYLVDNKLAKAREVAVAAAEEFGDPLLDLAAIDIAGLQKDLLGEELITKHQVLPLMKRGSRLFVAIADPANLQALDEIRFNTGLNTEAIVVESDKLTQALEKFLSQAESKAFEGLDSDLDNLETMGGDEVAAAADDGSSGTDDAPIVRFVNKLLLDAVKGGSSDLHFEPYEKSYRVRFRTDGMLHEVVRPPVSQAAKIAARLKVMANLDISERRVPQDGRIKMKISKTKAIDFRVNTCPTLWGEKIVLRILDPDSAKIGIEMLGFEPHQKELYMAALERPQGMLLVTGPTGSGKTVTLYTGVNILNEVHRNISTAEDPVEINFEGVNQVNVNPKQGMDFSAALKAFLRQDPDVILVGEIRDLETASIAVKAAQTGHMVLSTLHTNSAPETLTRLRNMGVPSFNIATSVNLIIAQRLGRRLCEQCKAPQDVPPDALKKFGFADDEIGTFTVYGPVGCERCKGGYKGRVGVYEVVRITDAIARIIMEEGNSIQIGDQCRKEGFNDLRRSGLNKVKMGLTSLAEVDRITS